MLKILKKFDHFTRNIILVFAGASLANFLNLLYQLLLAHRLSPPDFAVFNSILALFMLVASPLGTLQLALAKQVSEFNARRENNKIIFLISDFLKKASVLFLASFFIFLPVVFIFLGKLRFSSVSLGYILALLIALSWLSPVFLGALQGLELFPWMVSSSLISGVLKLAATFVFILLGFNVSGALGGLLFSVVICILIQYFPLRKFISLKAQAEAIDYRRLLVYLFPVAAANFCYIGLVSFDMVLVRYFFSPQDSGLYALAQMAGKIFLFLPGAISLVMFPRTSSLNSLQQETKSTLKRSLFFVFALCFCAILFFNLFPQFVFKVLTGKIYPESILLGRLFGISMSAFAVLFVLVSYLLSIRDLRFIKYLILGTLLELLAIVFLHQSLVQVQIILCLNAILLCIVHFILAFQKRNL